VYKSQLHWGTKCGRVGVQTTAALGYKMQLCFVPQHGRVLCTNTAAFYAPTRPHFVHGMLPCWCTYNGCILFPNAAVFVHQHGHVLYTNTAGVYAPTQLCFMHPHSCVLCTECSHVGAPTMTTLCSPMQLCFVDLRYKV